MPNPTRQEILDAHEELEKLCNRLPGTRRAKMTILAALPLKPQPTMAEVEWNDDLHYLAEAEHPDYGKVIMLERSACPGFIRIALAKENEPTWQAVKENTLTPTGKRYTLTEIQE